MEKPVFTTGNPVLISGILFSLQRFPCETFLYGIAVYVRIAGETKGGGVIFCQIGRTPQVFISSAGSKRLKNILYVNVDELQLYGQYTERVSDSITQQNMYSSSFVLNFYINHHQISSFVGTSSILHQCSEFLNQLFLENHYKMWAIRHRESRQMADHKLHNQSYQEIKDK